MAPLAGSVPAVRADASAATQRAHLPRQFWPRALQRLRSMAGCSSSFRRTTRKSRGSRSPRAPRRSRSSESTSTASPPNKTPSSIPRRWATRSRSLRQLPPGKYWIQALLHKYETFHRAIGPVVKLPMDRGEGQQWNKAPGNLYSTPREITIEASPNSAKCDSRPPRQGHPAHCRSTGHQVHQA